MRMRIAFTASEKIVSRLIRFFTKGRVSHAYIDFDFDFFGNRWAMESTIFKGARLVPARRIAGYPVRSFWLRNFDSQQAFKDIAYHIGDDYDYRAFFVIGWIKLVRRLFRLKIRHPLTTSRTQLCSELIARLFIAAKLPTTETWVPEWTMPEDLLSYCEKYPQYFSALDDS